MQLDWLHSRFGINFVIQPFADIHYHQLTAHCVARLFGLCTLLLLMWKYVADLKAGRVVR